MKIDEVDRSSREKQRVLAAIDERMQALTARMEAADEAEAWLPFRNIAIIVGAMKGGAATLYSYLRRHPQVTRNLQSAEPNFFGRPRRADAVDGFQNGWPWYLAQWDFDPARHRWALEASTSYTKLPVFDSSFARMKAMPLEYRLIYVLRDPIDRLEAQIRHSLARGRVRPDRYSVLRDGPLGTSRYATQIDHILEHFDRRDLLVLAFTDLCARPAHVLSEVHRFLGLDEHDYGDLRPRKARVVKVPAQDWALSGPERRRVYAELAPDLARLKDVHGFPVDEVFPTVARLAAEAGSPIRGRPARPPDGPPAGEAEPFRRELVHRIRGAVAAALPPGAVVAVVSKGDDDLLDLGGHRQGWHFPADDAGRYAGHHPADSGEAIRRLEAIRARGADYLLLPATASWWLDHYEAFGRYLEENLTRVLAVDDAGTVYAFPAADPVVEAEGAIEAALATRDAMDLSWLGPLPSGGWTLAADALRFLAALVAQAKPRHVMEFGSGLSTRLLARAGGQADPGCAVSSIDHDPDFLRVSERELERDGERHVVFQSAPLVLRRCFDRLVPVYRLDPDRLASRLPADLILIDGPPAQCGGREGTLYQALEFCRPGTIVVLDDANREGESATLSHWQRTFGEDVVVRSFPEFERGLATVIIRSTRRRRGLNEARADANRRARP